MGLRTICDHIIDIAQNAVDSGTEEATLRIVEKRRVLLFRLLTGKRNFE